MYVTITTDAQAMMLTQLSRLRSVIKCQQPHQLRQWILYITTNISPLFLGTNLIHDFTAVTFSVKLAVFHEKCTFP